MWSIDNESISRYLSICTDAVKNDKVFANFKRHQDYSCIVTGQSHLQGQQYLQKLIAKKSFLLEQKNVEIAKKGDNIGNPVTCEYEPLGSISANIIRYMNVLQELSDMMVTLDNLRIIEIGGGYGGQCSIIKDFFRIKSYEIIDIPEVLSLQDKYLKAMNHHDIKLTSCHDISNFYESDLLISNYGISELNKDIQDFYIQNIIKNSKNGYITYNSLKKSPDRNKPYSDSEFKDILMSFGFNVRAYNENINKSECEVIIWGGTN
jgi:putative sugar O-methyltransferase